MSIRQDYKAAPTAKHRRQTVRRHGLLVITLALIGSFGGLLAYIKQTDPPPTAAVATATTATAPTTTPAPVATPSSKLIPTDKRVLVLMFFVLLVGISLILWAWKLILQN